jgi:hypothetical protein
MTDFAKVEYKDDRLEVATEMDRTEFAKFLPVECGAMLK